jgi:gamma-glutamyltranspeptidase / glutathione hydrolase / leukotriene-C4 hydrolase
VVHPHSAGIGGGFLMTIYDSKTGKAECLNAREMAPAAATENMFSGNASLSIKGN